MVLVTQLAEPPPQRDIDQAGSPAGRPPSGQPTVHEPLPRIGSDRLEIEYSARMDDASIDAVFRTALEPVLSDLARTAAVSLKMRACEPSDVPGLVTAMIVTADGSGTGISVALGDQQADRVLTLADQLQEIVVEALWSEARPATWPECPEHPGTHPLRAVRVGTSAMWICPTNGSQVAEIGSLSAR